MFFCYTSIRYCYAKYIIRLNKSNKNSWNKLGHLRHQLCRERLRMSGLKAYYISAKWVTWLVNLKNLMTCTVISKDVKVRLALHYKQRTFKATFFPSVLILVNVQGPADHSPPGASDSTLFCFSPSLSLYFFQAFFTFFPTCLYKIVLSGLEARGDGV